MNRAVGQLTLSSGVISFCGRTPSGEYISVTGNYQPTGHELVRSDAAIFTFDDFKTIAGAHRIVTVGGTSYIGRTSVNIEAEPKFPWEKNLRLVCQCLFDRRIVIDGGAIFVEINKCN